MLVPSALDMSALRTPFSLRACNSSGADMFLAMSTPTQYPWVGRGGEGRREDEGRERGME